MNSTVNRFNPPWLRRYGVTALLAASGVGIAAMIGYEMDWGHSAALTDVPTRKTVASNAEQALLPSYTMPPIDPTYQETVERPLFIPTRRPAPAGSTTVASMRKGQYKLTGTAINAGMTVAYLVEISTGKGLRANLGAEVLQSGGIKIDKVEATRVVLRQGDETEELTLRTANSPRPSPTALAANQAPPGQTLLNPNGASNGQQINQPPFPPGMPGEAPGQFAGLRPPLPGQSANTALVGAANSANAPKSPAEASSLSGATPQPALIDPAASVLRRRRFQNLPQQ